MVLGKKIVELLSKGEPMKAGEIAETLGVDKKEVDKELKSLKGNGEIVSPKRCFYSVEKVIFFKIKVSDAFYN